MVVSPRRRSVYFFAALGVALIVLAVALNVGWIVLNWRTGLLFVLGSVFFLILIAGLTLNTIFLIREIRRNEQHDAFLNAVTHELKTPVASIRLYLETLQKRNLEEDKRQEFYRIMLADSDRLITTIEQVLRAARTSTSKSLSNRTRLDLGKLVEEVLDLARLRHRLPPEALQYAYSGDSRWEVIGDPDELKSAVSNLLDNAIKYSGQNVRVLVRVEPASEKSVAVRVRDQGMGIPRPELKRIFRRFYRIPGAVAVRVKGTGIGLFIVRTVAERHGGKAYAESGGAGLGSTFTLELPLAGDPVK